MTLRPLRVLQRASAFAKKRVRRAVRKRWLHRLKNRTFTLISNDCWGGEVYRDFNLPYNTPFVGLMVMAPCYLALVRDLKYYLEGELRFRDRSKYDYPNALREKKRFPVGILGRPGNEVEVHFLHYDSEEEARQKWTRRVARINWQNLVVKFDGSKDYCTDEILAAFDALALRKVCFTAEKKSGIPSAVYVPGWVADGKVLFKKCLPEFDVADWLNGGGGAVTPGYRLLLKGLRLGEEKNH